MNFRKLSLTIWQETTKPMNHKVCQILKTFSSEIKQRR